MVAALFKEELDRGGDNGFVGVDAVDLLVEVGGKPATPKPKTY